MCCLLFVIIAIAIAIFAVYVAGAIIGVNVVLFILLVASILSYNKANRTIPTSKKCPNCGSEDVTIQSIQSGTKTESRTYGNTISSVTHPIMKKVAACQKCGNSWDYISEEEVYSQKHAAKTRVILFGVLFAAAVAVSLLIFNWGGDDDDEDAESRSEISETSVEEQAGINDFLYDLEGDSVVLGQYNGDANVLRIESEYDVGGNTYTTDLSDFQVEAYSVDTLILDEGISSVNTSIFNGSNVENIYFPKSMELVYDYTLSYLHPDEGEKVKVYYAGTEEEWNQIFTEYQRTSIADAELGEELGTALADKLNEIIGGGYDSSEFEFYFSASPDEMSGD